MCKRFSKKYILSGTLKSGKYDIKFIYKTCKIIARKYHVSPNYVFNYIFLGIDD